MTAEYESGIACLCPVDYCFNKACFSKSTKTFNFLENLHRKVECATLRKINNKGSLPLYQNQRENRETLV
jgi:hypothetical protein